MIPTFRSCAGTLLTTVAHSICVDAVASVTQIVKTEVLRASASVTQSNLFPDGFPQAEVATHASHPLGPAIARDAERQIPVPVDEANYAAPHAEIVGLAKLAFAVQGNILALMAGLVSATVTMVSGAGGPV